MSLHTILHRKCDKYCHANTAGGGLRTRYEKQWRSACRSGMARARPTLDDHFPLVGAEDGAHHVGDRARGWFAEDVAAAIWGVTTRAAGRDVVYGYG